MKCPACGKENPEGQKFCGDCGIQVGAVEQAPVRKQFCVNLLGLAGAVVGVAAIFSSWLSMPYLEFGSWNLVNVLLEVPSEGLGYWAAIVFIIGTVISFASSVGFVPQLTGVVLWLWYYLDGPRSMFPPEQGSIIGLASAILALVSYFRPHLVLISMVRPHGPGLMRGPFDARQRLLVFSRCRQ